VPADFVFEAAVDVFVEPDDAPFFAEVPEDFLVDEPELFEAVFPEVFALDAFDVDRVELLVDVPVADRFVVVPFVPFPAALFKFSLLSASNSLPDSAAPRTAPAATVETTSPISSAVLVSNELPAVFAAEPAFVAVFFRVVPTDELRFDDRDPVDFDELVLDVVAVDVFLADVFVPAVLAMGSSVRNIRLIACRLLRA
jgi:hypothetical protein